MIDVINACGAIRQQSGDEELWQVLYFMFQDYVRFVLFDVKDVKSELNKEKRLEYCGLCQCKIIPNKTKIIKSHLEPAFVQNFVYLRRLPTRKSSFDRDVGESCAPLAELLFETWQDANCLPLLCQSMESQGVVGCEDLFSKWEQSAMTLLFNPIIDNLRNQDPITIPFNPHVYKFCISLMFRAILQIPRQNSDVSLLGLRMARWILVRRLETHHDVAKVYVSVPDVGELRTEAAYLNESDERVKHRFLREMLDVLKSTLVEEEHAVVVSCGPIHFYTRFDGDDEPEIAGDESTSPTTTDCLIEYQTVEIKLAPNGTRIVDECVAKAAMIRARDQNEKSKLNVPLAMCVLENSERPQQRVMAQLMIDVDKLSHGE